MANPLSYRKKRSEDSTKSGEAGRPCVLREDIADGLRNRVGGESEIIGESGKGNVSPPCTCQETKLWKASHYFSEKDLPSQKKFHTIIQIIYLSFLQYKNCPVSGTKLFNNLVSLIIWNFIVGASLTWNVN